MTKRLARLYCIDCDSYVVQGPLVVHGRRRPYQPGVACECTGVETVMLHATSSRGDLEAHLPDSWVRRPLPQSETVDVGGTDHKYAEGTDA